MDLIRLLYTSLNDELYSQEEVEMFVQEFYYELKRNLEKLDYDLIHFPTLQDFQIEMIRKLFYGESMTLHKRFSS